MEYRITSPYSIRYHHITIPQLPQAFIPSLLNLAFSSLTTPFTSLINPFNSVFAALLTSLLIPPVFFD